MNFKQKVSAYTLSLLSDKDLPDIALTALEEGIDSDSLRILAGYTPGENSFKLAECFSTSLKEIGFSILSPVDALVNVISFHANAIVEGRVDPYNGFQEIVAVVSSTPLWMWDIKLEDCYATYISVWEVSNDGLELHKGEGLTKEAYIEKEKGELVILLESWLKFNSVMTENNRKG